MSSRPDRKRKRAQRPQPGDHVTAVSDMVGLWLRPSFRASGSFVGMLHQGDIGFVVSVISVEGGEAALLLCPDRRLGWFPVRRERGDLAYYLQRVR